MITNKERIESYNSKFPKGLLELNNRIYGVWVVGNNYRNNSNLYGEYPHSIKERILSLFPDCKNILHLFSGSIQDKDTIRYDISDRFNPTICNSVDNILNYKEQLQDIDLVMADPPYEDTDFIRYDCKPFNKSNVLRNLAVILKPNSIVAWLDTKKPMYRNDTWFLMGEIMVSVSTNHRYRGLCIFQRLGESINDNK